MYDAAESAASTSHGSTRCQAQSTGLSVNGTYPFTGTMLSQNPNTKIASSPTRNDGEATPTRANPTANRSNSFPRRSAAPTPSDTPATSHRIAAPARPLAKSIALVSVAPIWWNIRIDSASHVPSKKSGGLGTLLQKRTVTTRLLWSARATPKPIR